MEEKWFIKNSRGDFDLIGRTHQINPVIAQLIVNRGITGNEEMQAYLHPSLKNMHNPLEMKDLERACDILIQKIKEGKTIRIIGDYDVDGVMATYILMTGLELCGAKVDYEIPDRIKDGYGINKEIITACIRDEIDTILTCDNGIAAGEEIAFAKENGRSVIITDHHDIPLAEGIPPGDAVVNPKQKDCAYPFKGICGGVVAFKLVEALYDRCSIDREKRLELLEFAAIATVCDVMDLKDENRAIVKKGIECFQKTKNIGLKALIKECGLTGKEIDPYHFGFVIGPCINASGRLESAKLSLELLLSKEKDRAEKLAKELKELNDIRKDMTAKGLEKAIEIVENTDRSRDKILVVYVEDCHESLAGIIAGRLKERYYKPTIVLTNAKEGVKGSGRSIEEYNMFEELTKCRHLLNKFGGHPMAAGISLDYEKVEELRKELNQNTTLTQEDLCPKISFDMVLPFEKINLSLIEEMEELKPYGRGNEKPLFALKNVEILGAKILGKNKNVLKLQVKTDSFKGNYTAMIFQNHLAFLERVQEKYGKEAVEDLLENRKSIRMDLIFQLNVNEYNGMESVQLMVQNFR